MTKSQRLTCPRSENKILKTPGCWIALSYISLGMAHQQSFSSIDLFIWIGFAWVIHVNF